ncbi:thiamine pyrophosphate-dependent enzyme [Aeromicrobium sp. CF4.19]|uniref:thiamine pyrophosphate-dependent enzyme n=1 Tax=Aeromicrobium sp. CF4.19 TaxID=3373082 RepID=UPI003EE7B0FA
MGASTTVGLGLALARPERSVCVVTGDGELLMNVGALATIAVLDPGNLSILVVDNGRYGETGNQVSHTGRGVDLERIAAGAGFRSTATVDIDDDIAHGHDVLLDSQHASFVVLRVDESEPPKARRSMDAAVNRVRFRDAVLTR